MTNLIINETPHKHRHILQHFILIVLGRRPSSGTRSGRWWRSWSPGTRRGSGKERYDENNYHLISTFLSPFYFHDLTPSCMWRNEFWVKRNLLVIFDISLLEISFFIGKFYSNIMNWIKNSGKAFRDCSLFVKPVNSQLKYPCISKRWLSRFL